MPEASASFTVPVRAALQQDALPRGDNPGRAFANGLMFALPLWGLVGVAIWAIV